MNFAKTLTHSSSDTVSWALKQVDSSVHILLHGWNYRELCQVRPPFMLSVSIFKKEKEIKSSFSTICYWLTMPEAHISLGPLAHTHSHTLSVRFAQRSLLWPVNVNFISAIDSLQETIKHHGLHISDTAEWFLFALFTMIRYDFYNVFTTLSLVCGRTQNTNIYQAPLKFRQTPDVNSKLLSIHASISYFKELEAVELCQILKWKTFCH